MSEVKRLEIQTSGYDQDFVCFMEECDDGDYVEFAEYDKLEQQLKEVVELFGEALDAGSDPTAIISKPNFNMRLQQILKEVT